jgi:hypothetical protein
MDNRGGEQMATIAGSNRRDYLKGSNNDSDDIMGFKGGDWLKGQDGNDNFIYTSIDDSPASWGIGTLPFIGFSYLLRDIFHSREFIRP